MKDTQCYGFKLQEEPVAVGDEADEDVVMTNKALRALLEQHETEVAARFEAQIAALHKVLKQKEAGFLEHRDAPIDLH